MPGYRNNEDGIQGLPLYVTAATSGSCPSPDVQAHSGPTGDLQTRTSSQATNRESNTAGRLGKLIRHNSSIIAGAAETAVLPKNRRSIKQAGKSLGDVESGEVAVAPVKKLFPFFIVLISIIEIFMFYVSDSDDGTIVQVVLWYDPYRRHELWRYFTVMLTHGSASHLWGNIVFQIILGCLLEVIHHWRRVGIVYICGVVGGTLALTVIDPKSYLVGASAGVYALLASHLVTLIINWQEMERRLCRIFWLLLYIVFDIALAYLVSTSAALKTNTSHAGHFGGALAGFLIGVLALKNFRTLPWEMTFRKICIGIITMVLFVVVIINISFPSYYYPTEFNTDYILTVLKKVCLDEETYKLVTEHCQEVSIYPVNRTITN